MNLFIGRGLYYCPQTKSGAMSYCYRCVSVHRGGCLLQGGTGPGGPGPGGGAWSWGVCLLPGRCACSWGVCLLLGGACSRGCLVETPPPDGYCCGRYASYWNAFLFLIISLVVTYFLRAASRYRRNTRFHHGNWTIRNGSIWFLVSHLLQFQWIVNKAEFCLPGLRGWIILWRTQL